LLTVTVVVATCPEAAVCELTPTPGELIRLHGADGKLADYKDTPYTRAARAEVAALNEALQSVSISLASAGIEWNGIVVFVDGQFVHSAHVTGYRVFNRCWKLGGRYYRPFWQNLPRNRRLELTIDGERVDEHDFHQLHPRLLYAEFGSQPHGDAYTIAGYEEQRDIVKEAWQIMINAQ
jgi:hypothetical protein